MKIIINFSEIRLNDLPLVGGKNASLEEMFSTLLLKGIRVPDEFAVASEGYWNFLDNNKIVPQLNSVLSQLNNKTCNNLSDVGSKARKLLLEAGFPTELRSEIISAYKQLCERSENNISLAVRSNEAPGLY